MKQINGTCYDKADRRRDTKGGIIVPNDKFKEFVEFQKKKGGEAI